MFPFLVEVEWWTVFVSSEDSSILSSYLVWLSTLIKSEHFNKIWGVVKGWKGLLEVSCAASCLHTGMSPVWPVMFWVFSRRNYTTSQGNLFRSCPLSWYLFFLYYIGISYIAACVFCVTSFCSAHLRGSDSVFSTSSQSWLQQHQELPFSEGLSNVPDNLSVLKLLYLLSQSGSVLISGIQLWFRVWIDNVTWATLVHVFSLWEIWNNWS